MAAARYCVPSSVEPHTHTHARRCPTWETDHIKSILLRSIFIIVLLGKRHFWLCLGETQAQLIEKEVKGMGVGGVWLSIPAAWLASEEKQETKTFGPNSCLLNKVGG